MFAVLPKYSAAGDSNKMPSSWNTGLSNLITLLASLYSSPDQARIVLRHVGLDPARIDLAGPPNVVWLRIVEEANKRALIPELLRIAKNDFSNVDFETLGLLLDQQLPTAPELGQRPQSPGVAEQFEQVTGQQPTFLPVSFLETGLLRSRSVARVSSPKGLGTGFLTHKNLLITNHHVIRDRTDARHSEVWFNYQTGRHGTDAQVSQFALDPDIFFATSSSKDGDDWTAVAIKGDANAGWGGLELADIAVSVNDFVNIIQHPGGMPKQIAMYHNVVVYADHRRIQYLTDTMPGSSGSPVFDSQWRVVALHHSGGWLAEPGSKRVFFRNEGISVRILRQALLAKQGDIAG